MCVNSSLRPDWARLCRKVYLLLGREVFVLSFRALHCSCGLGPYRVACTSTWLAVGPGPNLSKAGDQGKPVIRPSSMRPRLGLAPQVGNTQCGYAAVLAKATMPLGRQELCPASFPDPHPRLLLG